MTNAAKRVRLMSFLKEYQKAVAIVNNTRKQLWAMGAMDEKGARIEMLTNEQINELDKAYEEGERYLAKKGMLS